jgi:hypothetical protein
MFRRDRADSQQYQLGDMGRLGEQCCDEFIIYVDKHAAHDGSATYAPMTGTKIAAIFPAASSVSSTHGSVHCVSSNANHCVHYC